MIVRENVLASVDVCPPGTVLKDVDGDDAADAARLKALADPTRLRIMRLLAANGQVCACNLEQPLGLSQPTVSHHLRQLTDAGMVTRTKRGTWAFYAVDRAGLEAAVSPVLGLASSDG